MAADGLYIGLISGTSADGIDAALGSFAGHRPDLVASHLHPYPAATRQRLLSLFTPGADQLDLMGALDVELGELFAQASLTLLRKAGVAASAVAAIGSHGQTIRHRPRAAAPFTLQIADPNRIAHTTGIDVVADFRRRDLACGGEGAPLAPLFHQACLGAPEETRVILNLGGIANITLLPAADQSQGPMAMDTGPASCLLDAWCQQHRQAQFDVDGAWAAGGQPDAALVQRWLTDPYFAQPAPKSTGREYFHLEWARSLAGPVMEGLPAQDVQATLLELSARSVAEAVAQLPLAVDRVLVCGGGAHNSALMSRLHQLCLCPVNSVQALGLDPDWIEAMCFAWLARCRLQGTALDTRPFTGARDRVPLGGIYSA